MALGNLSPVFDLTRRFWKCWLIERTIHRSGGSEVNERFTFSDDIPSGDLEEQKQWYLDCMHGMEENTIEYSQWTDESARKFELQNEYFDAVQYQRDNVLESCTRLGIPYEGTQTVYRMPGMATSQVLKIW